LLFHTHLLTFATACVAGCLMLPGMIRQPSARAKLTLFGAVVALAAVPWLVLTGFLGHAAGIPKARAVLEFPAGYLGYFHTYWKAGAAVLAGLAWMAVVLALRGRLPRRLTAPFAECRDVFGYLVLWLVVGYSAFLLLVPASSCFLWRLRLGMTGAGILLGSILSAALVRVFSPRYSSWSAVPLALVLIAMPGQPADWLHPAPRAPEPLFEMIEYLRGLDLRPGTRLYAIPNRHLPLTFYSGLPIQSIAPVRRSFLDGYPGEVLIIDSMRPARSVAAGSIRAAAARAGIALGDAEVAAWRERLSTRLALEQLGREAAEVEPPLERVPAFLDPALAEARRSPERARRSNLDALWDNPAIFRGTDVHDLSEWWPVFFYRFVDPAARSGSERNYAGRLRTARAVVLPSSWVVFHSAPLGAHPRRPLRAPGKRAEPVTVSSQFD
jgi:hypothetical protein